MWLVITVGGAITIVNISVALLEDVHVLTLTVVGLVGISGLHWYCMFVDCFWLGGSQEAIIMCNHI